MSKGIDVEFSAEQIAIGREWAPYLEALGIPTDEMTPNKVYETAGAIIKDPIVFSLRLALKPDDTPVLPPLLNVLKKMEPCDLQALRERVLGMKAIR
jgi:hypothetical protein